MLTLPVIFERILYQRNVENDEQNQKAPKEGRYYGF